MIDIKHHVICADGTTLSVQASKYHYCLPRNDTGPYTHVEVGHPSTIDADDEMMAYWDNDGERGPTDSVFPCVPIEVLNAFTAKHGGVRVDLAWWHNQLPLKTYLEPKRLA